MKGKASADEGLRCAIALLQGDAEDAGEGLADDGADVQAWAMLFASGVVVDGDSDPWLPVAADPHPAALVHVAPGTANYTILRRLAATSPERIRYTCTDPDLIASRAAADPVARRACMLLVERLQVQGDPVPEAVAAVLRGEGWARRRGPNPALRLPRDLSIIRAVQGLIEMGFDTYSSSGEGASAIALVQQGLAAVGARPRLTYEGVRDVWERRTHTAPRSRK